jgi:hypothetical protein
LLNTRSTVTARAQPECRRLDAAKPLDSRPADMLRLVTELMLDCMQDRAAVEGSYRVKVLFGLLHKLDLIRHHVCPRATTDPRSLYHTRLWRMERGPILDASGPQ